MRRQPAAQQRNDDEIDRLLAELRGQVARLHRLERASGDERELESSRQTIAELRGRLADVVGARSAAA
jgi:hypothetical protein